MILKTIKFFLENPCIFLKRNPNFERFEKSYYLSNFLWQTCYNLVKKIHVQKRERTSRTQLANIGLEKRSIWEEGFASLIIDNMALK